MTLHEHRSRAAQLLPPAADFDVIGNGCTSGHGICGLARLSTRSLAAVAIFFVTAIVTVAITGVAA